MDLVFATNNQHKIKEIKSLIDKSFNIFSLEDIGFKDDIPETNPTIEGNASQKSFYIYKKYKINCFADDTGLEIKSLNGKPGVYSARYAGDECDSEKNMKRVMEELLGKEDRSARFRTIISLIINGEEKTFEGIVNGKILNRKKGKDGFGYDPIFLPDGYDLSFAEMSLEEKNKISHRARATKRLIEYLNSFKAQ
ncbi:MAG: non-canonical purine NTP diphosphatase [Bacteroidales bacterium]|nr:non-canonical purine NTP diphosphatase [Bacteroidales bacterium]